MNDRRPRIHLPAALYEPAWLRAIRPALLIIAPMLFLLGPATQSAATEKGFKDAATSATPQRPAGRADSRRAVKALRSWLAKPAERRPVLAEQRFARTSLTKPDAARASQLLWESHAHHIRQSRAEEMQARLLKQGEMEMPFDYKIFGDQPDTGRSLFISMHGGGGGPKEMNDGQWHKQKRLYQPAEGVYLCPRAPTNTWNLWHQPHIDVLFDRLIENLIIFENVDPDRVYIMGYSAGGDGVYRLAPRMADRWAAASMMAGHPGDSSPVGLRNIGFTIHVGGKDSAYHRNSVAESWKKQLAALRESDPDGYAHEVQIHTDKGHWMDREDAVALEWMARFTREPFPRRVVWKQDGVSHKRSYWLAVPDEARKKGTEIVATYDDQTVTVETDAEIPLFIRLNDEMLDLDQAVTVVANGETVYEGRATRTIDVLARTLAERGDPRLVFAAEVPIDLTPPGDDDTPGETNSPNDTPR